MSSTQESEQMRTALTGLFSAYKERVESDVSEITYPPLYTIAFDYPEYKTGVTYHIFGSFAANDRLDKPKILTVLSANTHARIVVAANWNEDWPNLFNWEGWIYLPNRDKFNSDIDAMTNLVNKMAFKLRFNLQGRNPGG